MHKSLARAPPKDIYPVQNDTKSLVKINSKNIKDPRHFDERIMFPMISEASEFFKARAILDMELEKEKQSTGKAPNSLSVGVMLEVPGLLWQLEQLAPHLDFLSVGSNDLLQFAFAADRNNPQLSNRFDCLSPAALGLLKSIAETTNRYNL